MSAATPQAHEWCPLIVAHRGMWLWNAPENSAEAFNQAQKFGIPSECDVWPSADGDPVVIHDATLDRVSTGKGPVAACRTADLIHCRLRDDESFGQSIPLLRDVADRVSLVEIKPPDSPEFVRRVIDTMAGRAWILQSFDAANLEHAQRYSPSTRVALLVDDPRMLDPAASHEWPVHINHELLDDRVAGFLQDHQLKLGVWTLRDTASLLRVIQWRPDVLISDNPVVDRVTLTRSGVAFSDKV